MTRCVITGLLAFALAALLVAAPAQAQPAPTAAPAAAPVEGVPTVYEFSDFEQRLLDRALQKHNATLLTYPEAEGRTVTEILVETEDVFTPEDLWPDLLNIFHFTTQPSVVDREILVRPGETFRGLSVAESARNLRAIGQVFSIVLVVPVSGPTPDTVRILAIVKDIWSLRANTAFLFVGDTLSYLYLALSENNLFGLVKEGALTFLLEQDTISFGQYALDRRVFGSRVFAGEKVRLIFNRDSWAWEGQEGVLTFGVPLYSIRQEWAWQVDASGLTEIGRLFEGPAVRTLDDPDTAEIEAIPFIWHTRALKTKAQLTRSFGDYFKHNISFGHAFEIQRLRFGEDEDAREAANPAEVALFEQSVLPRSERSSAFYVDVDVYYADYLSLRDLDSFALQEDLRLGPAVNLRVEHADPAWGSQFRFERFMATTQWRIFLGDRDDNPSRRGDLLVLGLAAETRLQDGNFQDNEITASARNYSPVVQHLRMVTRASATWRVNDRENRLATLGGDSALRGYDAGALLGRSRLIANVELRTMPLELYTFHFGAIAFYDVGGVAVEEDLSDLALLHSTGLGFRFLNPASNRIVFRADWGLALNAPPGFPTDTALFGATFPGKITAGFEQAF